MENIDHIFVTIFTIEPYGIENIKVIEDPLNLYAVTDSRILRATNISTDMSINKVHRNYAAKKRDASLAASSERFIKRTSLYRGYILIDM